MGLLGMSNESGPMPMHSQTCRLNFTQTIKTHVDKLQPFGCDNPNLNALRTDSLAQLWGDNISDTRIPFFPHISSLLPVPSQVRKANHNKRKMSFRRFSTFMLQGPLEWNFKGTSILNSTLIFSQVTLRTIIGTTWLLKKAQFFLLKRSGNTTILLQASA